MVVTQPQRLTLSGFGDSSCAFGPRSCCSRGHQASCMMRLALVVVIAAHVAGASAGDFRSTSSTGPSEAGSPPKSTHAETGGDASSLLPKGVKQETDDDRTTIVDRWPSCDVVERQPGTVANRTELLRQGLTLGLERLWQRLAQQPTHTISGAGNEANVLSILGGALAEMDLHGNFTATEHLLRLAFASQRERPSAAQATLELTRALSTRHTAIHILTTANWYKWRTMYSSESH